MTTPSNPESRLQTLEEHVGFLERSHEQVLEEVGELNRQLRATADRIRALEARLARLATSDEPADPEADAP